MESAADETPTEPPASATNSTTGHVGQLPPTTNDPAPLDRNAPNPTGSKHVNSTSATPSANNDDQLPQPVQTASR